MTHGFDRLVICISDILSFDRLVICISNIWSFTTLTLMLGMDEISEMLVCHSDQLRKY